jgi:Uncharacterized protein conserved in bacteria
LVRRAVLAIALLLIPGVARAASHPSAPAAKGQGKESSKRPKKMSRYAAVEFFQINTKETLMLRFQDDRGRPIKGWQKRFDKFMRCHQTGAVRKMDTRLAHMLYQTARHYEGHRVEVVSGYRHPKVARNPRSLHKQGLACDFRMAGIANAALRDWLRQTFDHAGVGYYPNSVFVHLDNRKVGPSTFWIDYAGPGQSAAYAENPREDLRTGRAERLRASGDDAAGRAEGEDDMAQAGEAAAPVRPKGKAGQPNAAGKGPVEVKAPSDPFGD